MTAEESPKPFRSALASLHAVRLRGEVRLDEAPAPQRLAPYAVALTADVEVDDEELGTGRFVVLHDPAGHETWGGTFRIVTFARATVEPDLAGDPMLAEVGWAWLMDCLSEHAATFHAASGTVTRVESESFGGMADRPATAELEVRASWTPDDLDLGPHLLAWADLLCHTCGLQPVPSGVVSLPRQRPSLPR